MLSCAIIIRPTLIYKESVTLDRKFLQLKILVYRRYLLYNIWMEKDLPTCIGLQFLSVLSFRAIDSLYDNLNDCMVSAMNKIIDLALGLQVGSVLSFRAVDYF